MVKRDWATPENLFPKTKRFKLEQKENKLKITGYWSELFFPLLIISLAFFVQFMPYSLLWLVIMDVGNIGIWLFVTIILGLIAVIGYTELVLWLNKTIINLSFAGAGEKPTIRSRGSPPNIINES